MAGGDDDRHIDTPLLCAECTAIFMGLLAFGLLLSGFGFFTVRPPGEAELCQVHVLQLQNMTKADQESNLQACHELYKTVFNLLDVFSIPFLAIGALAGFSAFAMGSGIVLKHETRTPTCWRYAMYADIIGFLVNIVPAFVLPGVAAAVDAALAPVHAWFITIMVVHVGTKVANVTSDAQDQGTHTAAEVEGIVYGAYSAVSRVQLCITVGSFSMLAVCVVFAIDIFRSLMAIYCHTPDYNKASGSQLAKSYATVRGAAAPSSPAGASSAVAPQE